MLFTDALNVDVPQLFMTVVIPLIKTCSVRRHLDHYEEHATRNR